MVTAREQAREAASKRLYEVCTGKVNPSEIAGWDEADAASAVWESVLRELLEVVEAIDSDDDYYTPPSLTTAIVKAKEAIGD